MSASEPLETSPWSCATHSAHAAHTQRSPRSPRWDAATTRSPTSVPGAVAPWTVRKGSCPQAAHPPAGPSPPIYPGPVRYPVTSFTGALQAPGCRPPGPVARSRDTSTLPHVVLSVAILACFPENSRYHAERRRGPSYLCDVKVSL